MIMVQVKDKNGDIVRSVFVDTYYSGKVEVNGNLYQIPVINIYGLPHGTYDVTITVPYLEMFDHTGIDGKPSGSYDMYIDGIRIYNPAGGNAEAHGAHTEDDEAYRSVSSGDQDEDHHVIDLSEKFIDMLRDIEGVVDRTCGVEQDHTDDEHAERL